MLILTRKVEQGIVLNNDIVVRVLAVDGDRVKLGITAPSSVLVLREELYTVIREENRAAVTGQGSQESTKTLRGSARILRDETRR